MSLQLVLVILASLPTFGHVGESFGFGSLEAGRSGAGSLTAETGFSAYSNPALLAAPTTAPRGASLGILFMQPRFLPIENVVVENDFTSDKTTNRYDRVDLDYREVLGQSFSGHFRVSPRLWNLTLGATGFLPLKQLTYLDTGEAYVPEYVLHRSRHQRLHLALGLGLSPLDSFQVGIGANIGFGASSYGQLMLQSGTDRVSSMRFSSSLEPRVSAHAGARYAHRWFEMGWVIRLPHRYPNRMRLDPSARAIGDLAALDFNFNASSSLYYDPLSVEWGTSLVRFAHFRLFTQLRWQQWRRFKTAALSVSRPTNVECEESAPGACVGIDLQEGPAPRFPLRNLWVPMIGMEWLIQTHRLQAGYRFRPGIFQELPTGVGNALDPDQHQVSLGYGYRFETLWGHKIPLTLSAHVTYQHLVRARVEKTPGDETGDGSQNKIGAPGYDVGGKVWGMGLTATVEFP